MYFSSVCLSVSLFTFSNCPEKLRFTPSNRPPKSKLSLSERNGLSLSLSLFTFMEMEKFHKMKGPTLRHSMIDATARGNRWITRVRLHVAATSANPTTFCHRVSDPRGTTTRVNSNFLLLNSVLKQK